MNKPIAPEQLSLSAEMTREEILLQALPPHIDPDSPALKADLEKIDRIARERAEEERELALSRQTAERSAVPDDGEVCLVPNQEIILARIDKQTGDLWLKQVNWPDEDAQIKVSRELIPMFADQICDLLGIGSVGGHL